MKKQLENIGRILISNKESIAVAESVTAGHLQYLLSTCPNAQDFFEGGITTYNQQQKIKQLGINPTIVMENNAVSYIVAKEMAKAVAQIFMCDWSIGITGFSTPPDNNPLELPYCYFSIRCRNKEIMSDKIIAEKNIKEAVQVHFSNLVIDRLSNTLNEHILKPATDFLNEKEE